MAINFKEYTRIRDIVVKRNKRAAQAGLMPLVHFPTVAEIKAGYVDAGQAQRFLKSYYSGGSQVKTIRATGLVPETRSFPVMPKPKPLTKAEQTARRKEQQRDYRRRKRIRQTAPSPEKQKKYESYLKALETVRKTWKKRNFDIGIDLRSLTPSQAQAFVEYMDFRFSQGDFTQHYVIDEFIQDFSRLLKKGHKAENILMDYNQYLENRYQLSSRERNMEGLSFADTMESWCDWIGGM